MDDSLIETVKRTNNKITIEGVMISGRHDTTEQWVDPFSFEAVLGKEKKSITQFIGKLGDLDNPGITYEEFRNHSDYWSSGNRHWRYVIDEKNI